MDAHDLFATSSVWLCRHLKVHQKLACKHPAIVGGPAHLDRGLQLPTHGGPFGVTKNFAAPLVVELDAGHARRFAVRHAWNGR